MSIFLVDVQCQKFGYLTYRIQTYFKKLFRDKNYRKVRDHFHYTSKYRGATHSICNLKFNMPNEISVAFHRGSN